MAGVGDFVVRHFRGSIASAVFFSCEVCVIAVLSDVAYGRLNCKALHQAVFLLQVIAPPFRPVIYAFKRMRCYLAVDLFVHLQDVTHCRLWRILV